MKYLKKVETLPTQLEEGVLYYDSTENKVALKKVEPTPQGPEMVDLGLSVKWATCNVGATKETEGGYFFQWGETEGHDLNRTEGTTDKSYVWSTTPWGLSTPPMTTLDADHDAATAAYGNGYRIPTEAELVELTANTTVEWVTDYKGSGVNGRTFTASNGNSIFIQAVGFCSNSSVSSVGSYGRVWSSSLNSGNPIGACYLYFGSGNMGVSVDSRYIGYSVRAVCK